MGTRCKIRCTQGYETQSSEVVCMASKHWSSNYACQGKSQHPPEYTPTHPSIRSLSSDIEITNTNHLMCTCTEIRCPKLNMPANGGYKCSDGSYFNSRCEFFCAPGFGLKGQKTTTCQYNKVWSAGVPTCVGKPGFPAARWRLYSVRLAEIYMPTGYKSKDIWRQNSHLDKYIYMW